MPEDFLSRNLQRYPRLGDLFTTDVASKSRFLKSIYWELHKKPLTERQALKACQAIVERTVREVRKEG